MRVDGGLGVLVAEEEDVFASNGFVQPADGMELEEHLGEASCHLEALAESGADLVAVLVLDGVEEGGGLRG